MLWPAEHHFFVYSFCPDNLQVMTDLASACPDIDLGTAAVIIPWQAAIWGTPEARRPLTGDFEPTASFRFGGMPDREAHTSLNLFAKEVLPVLKTWRSEPAAYAAQ